MVAALMSLVQQRISGGLDRYTQGTDLTPAASPTASPAATSTSPWAGRLRRAATPSPTSSGRATRAASRSRCGPPCWSAWSARSSCTSSAPPARRPRPRPTPPSRPTGTHRGSPPTRRPEPPRPRDPSRTPRTRRSAHGLQAPTSGRRPFTDTANPSAGPRTAGTGLPARRAPGTRHGAPADRLAAKIRRMKEVFTVNG